MAFKISFFSSGSLHSCNKLYSSMQFLWLLSFLYVTDYFSFFQSHPKVTQNLRKKFQVFHKRWLKENVDEEQEKHCKNWLLGRTEDNIPTSCIRVDNPSKPPYTPYNRYKVLEKT